MNKLGSALFLMWMMGGAQAVELSRLPLWPGGVPGEKTGHGVTEKVTWGDDGFPRIGQVVEPQLYIARPHPDKDTGAAVVVFPGGGYSIVAVANEGYPSRQWLTENGITAVMVKYRLPNDAIMADKTVGPLQDAQEAIRTVRRKAGEWGLDPKRIGVLGYSAGGHLAASLSTMYADAVYPVTDGVSARPDFSILIYPVVHFGMETTHKGSQTNLLGPNPTEELLARFSPERRVTADTPPAFLVHSGDDRGVPLENSVAYFLALRKAGVPGELHLYETGGHGYGLGREAQTNANWPAACIAWLKARGFLDR